MPLAMSLTLMNQHYVLLFFTLSFKKLFILKILAALGHQCYSWDFSSVGEWELLSSCNVGLLIVVASLVAQGLSSTGCVFL